MSNTIKVKVNDTEIEVPSGMTIMQACEAAGVEIPRFCYHERLSVAGNCRMCLVEVGNSPKPVASCAMPVAPNMEIRTDSESVKAARHGVMEFLLINHPLDCPICDQGGECDLQDQAFGYGFDESRFADNKRAVEDKNMGPLVKTIMTRCIHCTRCVRFATEVAGVEELGVIGRGEDMEITTYLEASLQSELSGNVIDLCPVGALTAKPYAFTARPWELTNTETIDVMDALGSHIRVDMRGREAMRILPREADDINEEWISDKTRFAFDGLNKQRLDKPYVRRDGALVPTTWAEAFATIATHIKDKEQKTAAIAGDLVCVEGQFALKALMMSLGSPHYDCRQDGAQISGGRGNYIFNAGIAGIDEAGAILIIGSNPRLESPVLNARLRKRWSEGNIPIFAIGEQCDLTYPAQWVGVSAKDVGAFDNAHFTNAKNPMVIIGQGALCADSGAALHQAAMTLAQKAGATFNVLHTAAGRVGGLDVGFVPSAGGRDVAAIIEGTQTNEIDNVILYGADEIDMAALSNAFVVYVGSHGDAGAHRADVILPCAAYTEKEATYVNTEGRVQQTQRATFPPGEAREDWRIFRALFDILGQDVMGQDVMGFDTLDALRTKLYAQVPHLAQIDCRPEAVALTAIETDGILSDTPLASTISNFYFTNPIARASAIMADCDKERQTTSREAAE